MSERFYLPESLDRPELVLGGSEAHHLMHVLRIGPGSNVVLFDGEGTEAIAEVVGLSRREVRLRTESVHRTNDAFSIQVTLAVAPPKGDRFRWLVEKATELGIARLVPLLTTRTVVDPGHGKLDKLRQTVVAACKQSERNHLMQIVESMTFSALMASTEPHGSIYMLHPTGHPFRTGHADMPSHLTILIGPEGGFTDDEVTQGQEHGAILTSLGHTILRTETAAIAASAILLNGLHRSSD